MKIIELIQFAQPYLEAYTGTTTNNNYHMDVGHSNSKLSTQILVAVCIVLALSTIAFGYTSWQSKQDADLAKTDQVVTQAQLDTTKKSASASPTVTPSTSTPTTSTNPTAAWLTYKSDRFAWSIKYPDKSAFGGETPTGMGQYGGDDKLGYNVNFTIDTVPAKVYVQENSRQDKTLEALIQTRDNVGMSINMDAKGSTYTVETINGQRAFKYELHTTDSDGVTRLTGINLVLLGDEYYYEISYQANVYNNPKAALTQEQQDAFTQFASTFTLL